MKIEVVLIKGNKKLDDMMHAFDVFESFKRLCWPITLELTFAREMDKTKLVPTPKEIDKANLIATLKEGVEKMGEEFVVAAFIPGEKEGAWVDESVKAISNGKSWAMIDKVLQSYGYAAQGGS